ncbi:hypothetical protein BCL64_1094 [Halomonas ventosae]|uniref:Uncharacterized protein n=1 Tax=Halomonas ventosae TaxID=229007 RepID=A0A2T0VLC1_9GAMM|nr:hypothetical protein BCL64_1094 [Halomonas ventosae]
MLALQGAVTLGSLLKTILAQYEIDVQFMYMEMR